MTQKTTTPFRIATLIFVKNKEGKHLLLKRTKAPNFGLWSPIGGKLDTASGESPFECAVRETAEETGFEIEDKDLHLFAYVSEKNYEGVNHWLLFLFNCLKAIPHLPDTHEEGHFGFFSDEDIKSHVEVPTSDKSILWPIYWQHHQKFVGLKMDCTAGQPTDLSGMHIETRMG